MAASRADGKAGLTGQGMRWWIGFHVYGLGLNPLDYPRGRQSEEGLDLEEDRLEDCIVWVLLTRPSGSQCNRETLRKYASGIRAYMFRRFKRTFGRGAACSIIPDLLAGYARLVVQPPPRERDGCTPDGLVRGMDACGCSPAWRAALEFGMVALARGCEFSLSAGEVHQVSEHMVPADVSAFVRGGVRHARVRMRKRKDLRVLRGKQAEVYLAGGSGGFFDAVADLELWLARRRQLGIDESRALFCHDDGSSFTVDQVRDMVKAVMQAAGYDPALYGAHSLRIGGATAALAAGVSPAQIRLMGRWSSDVYEIYCRMSVEAALGVGGAIAHAMVTPVQCEDGFHTEALELRADELRDLRGVSVADDDPEDDA